MARFRKPLGMRGFWPGRRSTFRRMTRNIRTPTGRMMRMTYTMPEKKIKDLSIVTAVRDTGAIALLNGLQLGTSVTTRIGQKIVIKSIHFKIYIEAANFSQTPTVMPATIRCMLIWDNQPNTQTPALSDILEDATNTVAIVSSQFTGYLSRFRILWDKRYTLTNAITNVQAPKINDYDEVFLKTNLLVSYSDTNNGDIQDIITGAIFFVTVSDSSGAANDPTVYGYSRIRYVDN